MRVDLITGFLGAGKTTFIKKYADYLIEHGERVHIIENEFGGLSIDAKTLEAADFSVSQIKGGCMCCSGRPSFQHQLLDAAAAGFDRVLVEPSGIYDVDEFFDMLLNPPVNEACEIGSIITIVDAKSDIELSPEVQYLMFSQLIFTGKILISKTQMSDAESIDKTVEFLKKLMNDHGSSRDIIGEDLLIIKPWDELTDEDMASLSKCGYRMTEHARELFDHMSVFNSAMFGNKFDSMDNLKLILNELMYTEKYGKIYRIKGYISDTDKNWYELNCTADGIFITPAKSRGLFVVIGQDYDPTDIENLFLPLSFK